MTPEQFPDKTWEDKKVDITLRQLVSHIGGIRHYIKPKGSGNGDEISHEFYLNKNFSSSIDALSCFKDDPLGNIIVLISYVNLLSIFSC